MLFVNVKNIGLCATGIENQDIIFIFFYPQFVIEKWLTNVQLSNHLNPYVSFNVSTAIHAKRKTELKSELSI